MILHELSKKLLAFIEAEAKTASKKLVFRDFAKYNFVNLIYQSLNLNDFMSIRDIEHAIKLIEELPVFSEEYTTLSQLISRKLDYQILNKVNNTADGISFNLPDLPKVKLGMTSNFTKALIETHQLLLSYYQEALTHTIRKIPVKKVNYDEVMLTQSQAFHDLDISTRELVSSDKSTIIPDVRRKGVTFYGAVIAPANYIDPFDTMIVQTIKNFTSDSSNSSSLPHPGSKASKIMYFGGQFLEAIVLNEFSNTIEFADGRQGILERGKVQGHINWSKNTANEVYATVNIKIYTFSFADNDPKKPQQFYAIGSDGQTLLPISDKDFERVYKNCDKERLEETENNLVPICEYNVKIKLDTNDKDQPDPTFFLKVTKCKLQINTPQLISSKEKQHELEDNVRATNQSTALI
ncbi:Uncharacterised protein [Legionella busanensis]|uniref:Uncharacterized protein n=1 Tax=Legionella busanensis TaxID=190655 RepID=A0A378JKN2_9GAMM|nr:hypothetical protein [Legionella busanensis]STX51291.1 Uncharacterised protein [Legionella busanensis]